MVLINYDMSVCCIWVRLNQVNKLVLEPNDLKTDELGNEYIQWIGEVMNFP